MNRNNPSDLLSCHPSPRPQASQREGPTPGSSCGGREETQQKRIGPPGGAALCVVV